MSRFLILAILCIVATASHATNNNSGCVGNCPQNGGSQPVDVDVNVDNDAHSYSKSNANADADASAVSKSQAASTAVALNNAEATNEGNDVTITEKHDVAASTPAAVVGNTTAACRAFVGISGMGTNGGGGLGIPLLDKDCVHMTLAQHAFLAGNPVVGWQLYCSAPTVRKVVGTENCLAASKPATPVVAPVASIPVAQCNEKIARCEATVARK